MLSLVDLVDAGTVSPELAGYLAAAMRAGASLLVGARPGGAGKTAVMCALLNFLPDTVAIRAVEGRRVLDAARRADPGTVCYLAHEIGDGPYYAYIWGAEVRDFVALAAEGHIIASNLHADTLEELRDQLCRQNGVDPAHLDAVTLKVFLRVRRARDLSVRRRISHVYESDGAGDRLIWTGDAAGAFARQAASAVVAPDAAAHYTRLLTTLQNRDVRRIAPVRAAVVEDNGAPRAGQETTRTRE
jgi:hypothetical protein